MMRLSFVIPAHNEEALIAGTICAIHESMAALNVPYEVIVAADGCTDATAAIAAANNAVVVQHDRRQIAATRNLGARAATGDLLVFVDGDTRVNSKALAEMLSLLQKGCVAGGGLIRFDGALPLYARALMPFLFGAFRMLNLSGGAFMFCTRGAFDAAGGWDERFFAGEEIHFARRLKKHGKFSLVREPVTTSGRKLRTHSARELFSLLMRGVFTPWIMKDRAALGFFYGPRRKDPMKT